MKVNCSNPACGVVLDRQPWELRRVKRPFCSCSCAAIVNNRESPKRRPKRQVYRCNVCNCVLPIRRRRCDDCALPDWATITVGELQSRAKYQISAAIRDIARRAYRRAGLPRRCLLCGYSRHVEVCHIRPIKNFPPSATIAEVNAITNLAALCPNHHWELDHGVVNPTTLAPIAAGAALTAPTRTRTWN